MLSSNDSVTQALLESFMAENCNEQPKPPQLSPPPTPKEHHIAPNIKLTEQVQVRQVFCWFVEC